MQEEMERKAVAISIKAGKLTADLLKAALRKALAEMEKSQKNPKIYHGKQRCSAGLPPAAPRFSFPSAPARCSSRAACITG